jgi:hypothetical protein
MGKREPYTFESPYTETRTVKDLSFSKPKNKTWVKIIMDHESWEVCFDQWKDLGKPSPGDELFFRISPKEIKS